MHMNKNIRDILKHQRQLKKRQKVDALLRNYMECKNGRYVLKEGYELLIQQLQEFLSH